MSRVTIIHMRGEYICKEPANNDAMPGVGVKELAAIFVMSAFLGFGWAIFIGGLL